ncbi:MAG: PspA/IM30 family protein [Spirochaetaceae bacterium]|nr:MAG: PspA/IM30 family protein [Spirochaetaceae bacterium]
MGLFDRFRRVVKSNINDMISKAENPEKMLNQLIVDMNQQLIESKKSVASAIADEKKLERQVNENRSQAAEWERKAMMALKAGKEDLAREALVRKQEYDSYASQLEEQWTAQHESVEKLKESLRGLQQKIDEAQRKKNLLIARSKRADAQKKIQQTVSGMSNSSAFEVFDRMAHRVDQLEAEVAAAGEIADMSSRGDELEDRFKELEGSGSAGTDRMLEDLKKRMSLEDNTQSGQGTTTGDSTDTGSSSSVEDDPLEELKKKMNDGAEE